MKLTRIMSILAGVAVLTAVFASPIIATYVYRTEVLTGANMQMVHVWATAATPGGEFLTVTMNEEFHGWLVKVETDPGSPAPTDNYDVYIYSADSGADLTEGNLENRDTSTSESYSFATPVRIDGEFVVSVTGNTQSLAETELFLFISPDK